MSVDLCSLSSPQACHELWQIRASRQVVGLLGQHGTLLLIRVSHGADRCLWQGSWVDDCSPRTMVYLSWGEQRPITRSSGHSAVNCRRSMDLSARSTRSLNSGPVITAAPALLAPFPAVPDSELPLLDPACTCFTLLNCLPALPSTCDMLTYSVNAAMVMKVGLGVLPLLEAWLSAPMLLLGLLDAECVLALPLEAGMCRCDAPSKMPQLLAIAAAVSALSPASTCCSAPADISEIMYTARHAPSLSGI